MKLKLLFFVCLFSISELFSAPSLPKTNPCLIDVCENAEEVAKKAAEIFLEEVIRAKAVGENLIFILPTGGTTIPFYKKLVKYWNEGKLDLSKVKTFNLDEYVGLPENDLQCYHYFMHHYFFDLVSDTLTMEKLNHFGLIKIQNEDLSHFQLKNLSLSDANLALDRFKKEILQTCLDCSVDYESIYNKISKIDEHLKKKNSHYALLSSFLFTDKKFPSLKTLATQICHHVSLKKNAMLHKNIHIPKGNGKSASDIQKNAAEYKTAFEEARNLPNTRCIVFCGIGVDPAHIAFNDLQSEKIFQDKDLSEESLTLKALQTEFRLVPLTEETRKVNSRFFEYNIQSVPTHALTMGFSELLHSDRLILLAFGKSKTKALYKTFQEERPSFQTPSSLIRFFQGASPLVIIDEHAFGLHSLEEESLAKMIHNAEEGLLKSRFMLQKKQDHVCSFENVESMQKPCATLNEINAFTKDKISLIKLPENKSILWLAEESERPSQLLKDLEVQNKVLRKSFKGNYFTALEEILSDLQVDYLYLPKSYQKSAKLREAIKKSSSPLLGIFYAKEPEKSNFIVPLSSLTLSKKIHGMKDFHRSQVKRTNFDLIISSIAEQESLTINEHVYPAETFYMKKFGVSKKGKVTLSATKKQFLLTKDFPTYQNLKNSQKISFQPDDLILAIAPHPDDAEIGLGGLLHEAGKFQVHSVVLNATDGSHAEMWKADLIHSKSLPDDLFKEIEKYPKEKIEDFELKKAIRKSESSHALEFLNPRIRVKFLNLPFYNAKNSRIDAKDIEIVDAALEHAFCQKDGNLYVFVPRKNDEHQTHRQTTTLFVERVREYFRSHPEKSIFIVYYTTPWTGEWNLYHYNNKSGSTLAAIVGSERLADHGKKGFPPKFLGGEMAERYFIKNLKEDAL